MSSYRPTKELTEIIIHCSATEAEGRSISAKEIDKWHRSQGYACIGYHYYIRRDGSIEYGRHVDLIGAHCKGHNRQAIGICYEGGLLGGKPADTRTEKQKEAMKTLIESLALVFPNLRTIHGHNEFAAKACPCFDVSKEYSRQNEKLAEIKKRIGLY